MSGGFVKLMRSEKTLALMGDPSAFTLASVIAYRAQRTNGFNVYGLEPGEALLGDYDRYGMSQSQYRTAKEKLRKWQIAAFKATSRGTIARLVDDTVYDINREPNDERFDRQMTSKARADDEPSATTKNVRIQEGKKERLSLTERASSLSLLLQETICQNKPDFRPPEDLSAWAAVIDGMIADGRDAARIETLIRFCGTDDFWRTRILSADALRRNFDSLDAAEQRHAVPGKEPKKCFRGCGRIGVDYGLNDAGQEYWWCNQCQPGRKGVLAKARDKPKTERRME